MNAPNSAADLRLVPHYVAATCTACGQRLVLVDTGAPPDEIWWDEWECINKDCADYDLCLMDWPAGTVARLIAKIDDPSETEPW